MVRPKDDISLENLRRLFSYEWSTGFIWSNTKGEYVGHIKRDGYRHLKIGRKLYSFHRVAWALHYGGWPKSVALDHINGNKTDNRIENLREATMRQNRVSAARALANKTGYAGVHAYFNSQSGKFYGYRGGIEMGNRKQKRSPVFETPLEAHLWYVEEGKRLHGEFFCLHEKSELSTAVTPHGSRELA